MLIYTYDIQKNVDDNNSAPYHSSRYPTSAVVLLKKKFPSPDVFIYRTSSFDEIIYTPRKPVVPQATT